MTRRWLFGTTLAALPAFVFAVCAPQLAEAQPQQPPPPAVAVPPVAPPGPQPPPPPPPAVAAPERPMRFILTGGTVVIGTRVGEDAEFFTVNTSTGLVRVRKSDIASMDYNISSGAAPVVQQPQQPVVSAPPPTYSYTAARPRKPGRGLLIAGTIVFSISYGLTVFAATVASVDNPDAFLLLLPVAGPIVYGASSDEVEGEGFALLFNLSVVQGAGLLMLIIGASKGSSSSNESQTAANELQLGGGASVRVDPVLFAGLQGLAFSGRF